MKSSELILKVITWRVISIVSMLLTMWLITGDLLTSTGVTVIVQIVQTVVHAIFESLWGKKRDRAK